MSSEEQAISLFDNAWIQARRRLALLEESLDEESLDGLTIHRLERIGVGAGWHCLDVGAGGGSVAQWLASRVGSTGGVLATDVDTRFLAALNAPNLEVRRHDISVDPLPSGSYDLVHTRLVLMHLPARAAVLSRLVTTLKPGGWVVVWRSGMCSRSAGSLPAQRARYRRVCARLGGVRAGVPPGRLAG